MKEVKIVTETVVKQSYTTDPVDFKQSSTNDPIYFERSGKLYPIGLDRKIVLYRDFKDMTFNDLMRNAEEGNVVMLNGELKKMEYEYNKLMNIILTNNYIAIKAIEENKNEK